MIVEHAAAVVARLEADPALTVFDEPPPDLTNPPYVRVYVSLDGEDEHSLRNTSDKARLRITSHSVGANDLAARIVADRVRTQLLDHELVVTGRACSPIDHETGLPPDVDQTTGRTVVTAVDVWTFWTIPA